MSRGGKQPTQRERVQERWKISRTGIRDGNVKSLIGKFNLTGEQEEEFEFQPCAERICQNF